MPVFHCRSRNVDESELKLPNSQLAQQRRDFRKFLVITLGYDRVRHDQLSAGSEIPNALDHLQPRPRGFHLGIVRSGIEAVDGGSEFVRSGGDDVVHVLFIGEFPPVGLDLDAFVSDIPSERYGAQQVGMDGRLTTGEHYRTQAFGVFLGKVGDDFLVAPLRVMVPFVSLYAEHAQVVARETDFHIHPLHGVFVKKCSTECRPKSRELYLGRRGNTTKNPLIRTRKIRTLTIARQKVF